MTQHAISKAEALEEKGLWRRAATQWLSVMQKTLTDEQREQVRRRRMFCLSQVKKTENPKNQISLRSTGPQQKHSVAWGLSTQKKISPVIPMSQQDNIIVHPAIFPVNTSIKILSKTSCRCFSFTALLSKNIYYGAKLCR